MSVKTDPGAGKSLPEAPDDLPSLRRIGEFLRKVMNIERNVRRLEEQNVRLEQAIAGLQRQVDEHTGQLKAVTAFVSGAADREESRSEEAALRTVERYLSALEMARLKDSGSS